MVWSSPVSRCRAVADRFAAHFAAPVAVDDALHELHFGRWEARTWGEIVANDPGPYARWARDWQRIGPPGGESACDLEERVASWSARLAPDETHALIAHAGVVRALNVIFRWVTWERAMRDAVPYLCWTRFTLGQADR